MSWINSDGKKIILTILAFLILPTVFSLVKDNTTLSIDYTKGWSMTTYTNPELGGNDINLNRAKYYLSEYHSNLHRRFVDTYFIENGKEVLDGEISSYYGKIIDFEGYVSNIADYNYDSRYNFDKIFENRLVYVTIVLMDNIYVHALIVKKETMFKPQDIPFGLGDRIKIRGFIIGKLMFTNGDDGIDFVGLMD